MVEQYSADTKGFVEEDGKGNIKVKKVPISKAIKALEVLKL